MDHKELHITVKKAFGNLHRKQCALIAVENESGKILIGAKPDFYPPSIARLLGGGVGPEEHPDVAAVRELREELGVTVGVSDLTNLLTFETYATDETGANFHNQTIVYYTKLHGQVYQAGDDVKQILALTTGELYGLGQRYDELSETLWCIAPEGEFCWADYGKMYGPIHKMVAKKIESANNSAKNSI